MNPEFRKDQLEALQQAIENTDDVEDKAYLISLYNELMRFVSDTQGDESARDSD